MTNRKTWLVACFIGISATVVHARPENSRSHRLSPQNQEQITTNQVSSDGKTLGGSGTTATQLTVSVNSLVPSAPTAIGRSSSLNGITRGAFATGEKVPAAGAEVSIVDVQTGQSTAFVMQTAVRTITLPVGTYAVSATRNGATSSALHVKLESQAQTVSLLIDER